MAGSDLDRVRSRVRSAYERGRLRCALLVALPALVLGVVVARIEGSRSVGAAAAAVAMYVVSATLYWRGLGFARGVIPGVCAGVVPFVAMHVARLYVDPAHGTSCVAVCATSAALGGVVAGALIGRLSAASEHARATWISAMLLAALIGSIACASIGIAGVVGLVVGLIAGSARFVLRPAAARSS